MTFDEPVTQTLGVDDGALVESNPPLTGAFAPVASSRFVIEEELARGASGRVVKAFDRELERVVALKELLPEAAHARARFEREALLAARLQHPSIIPVYDTGCWASGTPFIAMKLVTGETLQARLERVRATDERLGLVPVVIAVAEAIAYAHGERVVHRDLKPANILVGSFGEVVVIDWGLAAVLDATSAPPAGTPAYLAPEQASGSPPDERTDVFALGAILYHVLAGEPPVPARSLEEAACAVPRKIPETVPAELRAIVTRAIAKVPAERYPTARELAEDLLRFQAGQLVSVHSYSLWALLVRWVRRNRAAVTIASVLLTVLVVTGIVSIERITRANAEAQASATHAREEAERATDALAKKEAEERARKDAEDRRAATEVERQKALSQVETDQTTIEQSREKLVVRNRQLLRSLNETQAASDDAKNHEAAEHAANTQLEDANAKLEAALARERARVKQLEDQKKKLATDLP